MRSERLCAILLLMAAFAASTFAQQNDSCNALMNFKVPNLEISKATSRRGRYDRNDSLEPKSHRATSCILSSRRSLEPANRG